MSIILSSCSATAYPLTKAHWNHFVCVLAQLHWEVLSVSLSSDFDRMRKTADWRPSPYPLPLIPSYIHIDSVCHSFIYSLSRSFTPLVVPSFINIFLTMRTFFTWPCLNRLAHRGLNLVSLPACLWKCSNHGLYFYTLGEHLESFFPSSYFYLYSGFCPGWVWHYLSNRH